MAEFSSYDPATGETVWTGPAADAAGVDRAVAAARAAFSSWSAQPLEEREKVLRAFAARLAVRKDDFVAAISRETGKPHWEAATEVQSMIGKIDLTIDAHARRCAEFRNPAGLTRFKPHGVVAVLGPFNFPGHLPNGHIAPALLAGNAVVFKPSEYAPAVAELTAEAWAEAGLPEGALAVVPGGRDTGAALAAHPGLDGLFFTGSARAGLALSRQFAEQPEKILALEMGGNNPLVVHEAADAAAAALLTIQSAYVTAGQRCSCARRLIVPAGAAGDRFVAELVRLIREVRVGPATARPEPYLGPVISAATAGQLLAAGRELLARGARPLVEMRSLRPGTGLLSPGLLDVTGVTERADEEIFGPLLQLIRVPDFDAALQEANATRYGLAAGLVSDNPQLYARFYAAVRAGVINWNQPLTGASSGAPFGGVGRSGNHRPSAYFAADYCSYPVATIEVPRLKRPATLPPGLPAA
ncbi:MAG TPA: succinylglutamate-semialdehyde dehydrogenase [Opitutaceae bacterium]|nr:succinylglutamate-semialdehyde dehydrogenase [Opitutaceae bacterium]